jgi:hypothetical protein
VNTLHVLPVDDVIEHKDEDCVCGPRTDSIKRDDGSMAWVVVHNSLDGREKNEEKGA